jgi:GT2 family glycosyltransferase
LDLSVIIVNWNTRAELRACLKSLRVSGAELIVVDNASADESAQMVRETFPEVVLIANSENRGYAAANNQGIARSRGEFLMLLNPDTELPPEAPGQLVDFLRAHPKAGAVAPRLVHPDGRVQESVRGWPTPGALFTEATGVRLPGDPYRVAVAELTEPVRVPQPMTSCLVVRRSALEQVGNLDERFPIFFNDVDFCFRLWEAGWEVWYLPAVRVLHHGGASTRQVRPKMIRESHRSLCDFYAKHYRRRLPFVLYGVTVAAIRAVGALRWAVARVREGKGRPSG